MSEQDLLLPLKNGEEKAFEQLFKQHFVGLCLFAEHFVHDTHTAEEIVEDFFCEFWENCTNLTITDSIKGYLYRSIYNNSMKYLRHKKVEQKYITAQQAKYNEKELSELSLHSYPIANLIIQELESKIETEINKLPPQCKDIFCMSRYENLSYSEIAEKTGLSVNTVKTQISRALKKLRDELQDYLVALAFIITLLK
ncbi:MAG: RNA polymerase sigma-70 factor [Bacteroidota bacterium]|nr:RNA polymerase sigma-70 factor [Bacteroidota bacterium]